MKAENFNLIKIKNKPNTRDTSSRLSGEISAAPNDLPNKHEVNKIIVNR